MLLGIDISTTAAKALLIDHNGVVITSATMEYPSSSPKPLWSEQNPIDWWKACCTAIQRAMQKGECSAADIDAVGLTGQMHGLVLLDEGGDVLRPAILWNDQRTGRQCKLIEERAGGFDNLIRFTGNAVLPGFTAPKILWVRENEPDVYREIKHIVLPKDYIRYRLTGAFVTDVSDASGTALFDVSHRKFSGELCELLEIPSAWLPECVESAEVSAYISEESARQTGLPPGIPVVGGAGDQAAQAIGCGIVRPGVISVTTGTSGVVFAYVENYTADIKGRLHMFCHAVPDAWHAMGVMLSAGGSFQWFRNTLGTEEIELAKQNNTDPYDILGSKAVSINAGADGLLFLPYLTGERTPHPDPYARGGFIGLTNRHTKAHLIRAVLEGITFGLRDSLELIKDLGVPIEQIRISGGGTRSSLWRQIQADIFGQDVAVVSVPEGAAFGAALLAGVGSRVYTSVEEAVQRTVHITDTIVPDEAAHLQYEKLYPIYQKLYSSNKNIFRQLYEL